MANKKLYSETAYKNVVKKNTEYMKNHYKRVSLRAISDEKEAWKRAAGNMSLKAWIVSICTKEAENMTYPTTRTMDKQYVMIPLDFKPDEYKIVESKAQEANTPLAVWIRGVCDKAAGYEK